MRLCCSGSLVAWKHSCVGLALLAAAAFASPAQAQNYDILKECHGLSSDLDDIHVCLDNFLDAMDSRLTELAVLIERTQTSQAIAGFRRSQQAFRQYREANCLWYLDFNSNRRETEQLAKSCLAKLSQTRVAELENLLRARGETGRILRGFYVYGPSRNSFQPCGSGDRYWVEGDAEAVGRLQQEYLSTSTAPLQILYVSLRGEVDESEQTSGDYQGVLRLSDMVELRVPSDTDCPLPVARVETPPNPALEDVIAEEEPPLIDLRRQNPVADVTDDFADQELIAYFGDWQAYCLQQSALMECELSVGLDVASASDDDPSNDAQLLIHRQADQRTEAEVIFPAREIDSRRKIRWRVDETIVGDIEQASVQADADRSRLLVEPDGLEQDELLQKLIDGTTLEILVVDNVDDAAGERYSATLLGLTRALAFADEFIGSSDSP